MRQEAVCDGDASRMRASVRGIGHRDESTLDIAVISVTHSNYHKPFLSSSRRWTHRRLLEVSTLFPHTQRVGRGARAAVKQQNMR